MPVPGPHGNVKPGASGRLGDGKLRPDLRFLGDGQARVPPGKLCGGGVSLAKAADEGSLVTGLDSKFDLQLLPRCGSTSQHVPEILSPFCGNAKQPLKRRRTGRGGGGGG